MSHLFVIFAGLVFGIIGSLLSFYYPELLSKNITPLSNTKHKQLCSVVATLGSIVLIYMIDPVGANEWVNYSFIFLFYVIAWVDGYSKIIPNKLLLILLILAGINFWYELEIQKAYAFLTVILASLVIYWIGKKFTSKKIIGWGDVKLIVLLSLFLGLEVLIVIYIGIIISGVITLIGLLTKRLNKAFKLPLAPFLFMGFVFYYYVQGGNFYG